MNVNGISNAAPDYTGNTKNAVQPAAETNSRAAEETAKKSGSKVAVYESAKKAETEQSSTNKLYKPDNTLVQRLKAEARQREEQMQSLVENMMSKQGVAYNNATNIFQVLQQGKLKVDPQVAAQAKKDIAEDGYWGVNQTSDRLVSFAKALSGGDPAKADKMMAAVQKGFDQATRTWGSKLPDISKQTLDATMKKMQEWKNSLDVTGVEAQTT